MPLNVTLIITALTAAIATLVYVKTGKISRVIGVLVAGGLIFAITGANIIEAVGNLLTSGINWIISDVFNF